MYFQVRIKMHAHVIHVFLLWLQESYCQSGTARSHQTRFNIFMFFLPSTYFLVFLQEDFINCNVNNSIIFLLPNKFLFLGSCPWYLVVLILVYLAPKSPMNVHLSNECMGPWMRHVVLHLSFGWSTYLFLRLSAFSLISE